MNLGQKTDRAVFSFVYFVVNEMRLRENIGVCHKLVVKFGLIYSSVML